MNNPINKRVKRELKEHFIRYLAIFLIIFAAILATSSFFVIQKSVKNVYDDSHIEGRVESGQITTAVPLDDKGKQILEDETDLYSEQFSKEVKSEDKKIRVFKIRKDINIGKIIKGRKPNAQGAVALDYNFAKKNKIKINDYISISDRKYLVTGTIALPDYSALIENRNDLIMNNKTFGVALMNDQGFENLDSEEISYTYVYKMNKKVSEKKQADKLNNILEKFSQNNIPVLDGIITPLNMNICFIKDDMQKDIPSMYGFFILIIIIMALVFTVLIKSTLDEESSIIGTLLSMGYTRRDMILHFIRLPIVVTIVAAILGNIFSYTFFKDIYANMYYDNFSLYPLKYTLDIQAFIITTILPIALVFIIDYFMLAKKLRYRPLEFLRNDINGKKNKKAIIFSRLNFINRFRLRVFLNNKFLYSILFVVVIFTNLLLTFGMGLKPMMNNFIEDTSNTIPAKNQYILKLPVEKDNGEKLTVYKAETKEEFFGKHLNIDFYGVDADSKYYKDLKFKDDKLVCYASEGLLKKLNKSKGDTLRVVDKYMEKEFKVKITEKKSKIPSLCVYMDRRVLNSMIDKESDYFNSYLSDKDLDFDQSVLLTKINKEGLEKSGAQYMELMQIMSKVFSIISFIIFIVIIYVLSSLILDKSYISICYLRIFGYKKKEISSIYLGTTSVALIIFQIIAFPIVLKLFDVFIRISMSFLNSYIYTDIGIQYFIIPPLLSILVYFIVRIIQVRKINKTNLAEALKEPSY